MAMGQTERKLPRSIGPLGPAEFDDSALRGKRRTEQEQLARMLEAASHQRKPHDSTLYRSDRLAALRLLAIQLERELATMAACARRVRALIESAAPWTEDYHT